MAKTNLCIFRGPSIGFESGTIRVYEFGKTHHLVSRSDRLYLKILKSKEGKIACYKWFDHKWNPFKLYPESFDDIKTARELMEFIKTKEELWRLEGQ